MLLASLPPSLSSSKNSRSNRSSFASYSLSLSFFTRNVNEGIGIFLFVEFPEMQDNMCFLLVDFFLVLLSFPSLCDVIVRVDPRPRRRECDAMFLVFLIPPRFFVFAASLRRLVDLTLLHLNRFNVNPDCVASSPSSSIDAIVLGYQRRNPFQIPQHVNDYYEIFYVLFFSNNFFFTNFK